MADKIFEEIYNKGTTYSVVPKPIYLVEVGDKHLLPVTDISTGGFAYVLICTVIDITELKYDGRIRITYQDEHGEIFNVVFESGSIIYHFYKISKINLADKEFWRYKK